MDKLPKVGEVRKQITVVRKTKSGRLLMGMAAYPESDRDAAIAYAKSTVADEFVTQVWLKTETIKVIAMEEIL